VYIFYGGVADPRSGAIDCGQKSILFFTSTKKNIKVEKGAWRGRKKNYFLLFNACN